MTKQKQVEITDEILGQIERVTNTTIDPDNIVVFEAAALSTRPLHKPGSIYHAARPSRSMLEQMAAGLNSGEHSVPLHTLHLQGGEIPKGRVFHASVADEIDGSSTLRAMFYLPLAEKELIEKINLSILDEVSVGVKAEQALCSKCGFDYFGEDADFTHLWEQTCDNGHTLGENDTHLKLVGLDKWMELSLVSRGASDKPKILSRTKQLVSKDEYDRMAADGTPLEALVLFTSTVMEPSPMPKTPTPEELAAEAAAAEAAAGSASAAAAAAAAAAVAAEAENEEEPAAQFDAEAAIADLAAKFDALAEQLTPLLTAAASSEEEEEVEAEEEPSVEDLQAQLAAATSKITELEAAASSSEEEALEGALELPTGGVAASAVTDAKAGKDLGLRASAFKTPKKRR